MRPDKRHSYGMLWGGKVCEERKHEDKHTRAPQIKPSESEAKPKSEERVYLADGSQILKKKHSK